MATSHISTRAITSCPIFGTGSDLSARLLPTYDDVMKCYIFEKEILKQKTKKDQSVDEISRIISEKLQVIWAKADIPTVSSNRIIAMIKAYHQKYRNISKSMKSRSSNQTFKEKCENFKVTAQKLFDISACKCKTFNDCTCTKSNKIPAREQKFIEDQRNQRKMAMGSLDVSTSKTLTKKRKRQVHEASLLLSKNLPSTSASSEIIENSDSSNVTSSTSDDDFPDPFAPARKRKPVVKRATFPALAAACDRTGVSDRCAAMLSSSLMHDLGKVTSDVIDRSKIRRERRKQRCVEQQKSVTEPPSSLYFDGRKDVTLVQEKKGTKLYRRQVSEEHITLLEEPNSKFIGHISVESGSSKCISKAIFDYFQAKEIPIQNVVAIGCDGTAVNTGSTGGIIRLMEKQLGKPLQWFVCQLHANELPLRHLIEKLDGKTSGPRGFTGPIGKQLNTCESLPVVDYEPIVVPLRTIDKEDLSTDQKYMLDIHQAITNGICSVDLSRRKPGKMAHSRWLTTANRVLRLYVSTEDPSEVLQNIVQYVMHVYVPMWFEIKRNSSSTFGARHLFQTIQKTQSLCEEVQTIVRPVIQRNGYFAHPENILLAMIADDRSHVRELAWRRIKNARTTNKNTEVRIFKVPALNFEANDFIEIIDWQNTVITEPPLTQMLTIVEIDSLIVSKETKSIPKYPCHTQAVERHIKLVTEASASVCGEATRDGFIRNRIQSRTAMPRFDTKCQFNTK